MDKKVITTPLTTPPSELVSKVKDLARQKGATVEGDTEQGTFAALGVNGKYRIENNEVIIQITKKPMLLPWAVVEKTVRDFFA